jgi:hypothetical protein
LLTEKTKIETALFQLTKTQWHNFLVLTFFYLWPISSPKWSDVCCPWIEDSGAFFNFAHMMYANIPRYMKQV